MSVAVTDTVGTITINDGNSTQSPEKAKVSVLSFGDNVQIWWDEVHYVQFPYTDFTAPTGASAAAVAAAIAAFLDTGGGAASNSKTEVFTVGVPGVSGVDQNFTSAANMTEQSLQLDSSAFVPANSPITSIVVKCTEAVSDGGAVDAVVDVGNTSGGDELMSAISIATLNAIQSVSAQVSASASASSVYFSVTPAANWNTLTAGKWKIWVSYQDNSAN